MSCITLDMEVVKMKNYSLRVTILVQANSDEDAKRLSRIYVKELPRMDSVSIHKASVYNLTEKRDVEQDLK